MLRWFLRFRVAAVRFMIGLGLNRFDSFPVQADFGFGSVPVRFQIVGAAILKKDPATASNI